MTSLNTHIRSYQDSDYASCIQIFKSNVPKYFDAKELSDFEVFLKKQAAESFWVIEHNNALIGCGGIRIRPDGSGSLCYGMIDNSLHKNGFGKILTNYRLLQLLDSPSLRDITLDTSQHTYLFYKRFGFKQVEPVQKNFYGVGLDCHILRLIVPQNPLDLQTLRATLSGGQNGNNPSTPSGPTPAP